MILQPREIHGSLFIACSIGIAYTIDPAYAAEVREYLGEYIMVLSTFLYVSIILMREYWEKQNSFLGNVEYSD